MLIKTFKEPPIDNNDYLLIDENTKEAVLIDCSDKGIWKSIPTDYGDAKETIIGENREKIVGITLKYVLLTHGHFDHIGGLTKDINYPNVLMHKSDLDWIKNVNIYMEMMNLPKIEIPQIDGFIEDGDIITVGNSQIKVMHTPGHTEGSVCYYVDGKLFSGDTIFKEAVGRCDLPGGSFNKIVDSIENKIFKLPEETEIFPGHGKPTTVGWEKVHNQFM